MVIKPQARQTTCLGRCLIAGLLFLVTACQPVSSNSSPAAGPASVYNPGIAEASPAEQVLKSPLQASTALATTVAVRQAAEPTQPDAEVISAAVPEVPAPQPRATQAPATPPPTLAPSPKPVVRFVASAAVNVRAGPGTVYEKLGQISPGESHEALAANATHDWLQFAYRGGTGWVSASVVNVDGAATALPVATNILPPPPDRVVAPAIKLDTRVVPVGWHTVQTASGPTEVWDVASYAAGWHFNSARPGQIGNMVLTGHHNIEGEVFRYVVDLKVGDAITVFAGDQSYTYHVVDKFILPDKYVSAAQRADNAKWIGPFADQRLTLVTCWPYTNNTHRVIVIAKP
jgi:LPXTG-site transpeptidase (sortase) family protein